MKTTIIFAFIFFSFLSNAQHRKCGTDEIMKAKLASDPVYKARHEALEQKLYHNNSSFRQNGVASPNVVVTIPVVVHVIYKNDAQNISDAQINSQIAILNADFRKLNSDFTTVVPAVFQPLGADLEIQFVLAKRTIDNFPTTGIERKLVNASFNFQSNYFTASGLPAWEPTKYLNIWVGRFASATLLGFAYLPSNAGAPNDGLCIGDRYFGNTGTAIAPIDKGRTATHEIGHYFNLEHPWGDGSTTVECGVDINSDYVADTPSTLGPYIDCPTFPDNSYTCTNSTDGAMFMNYMDYVNDACMAFFTADQKTRVIIALNGPRASLLTSQGAIALGLESYAIANAIKIYPNPSTDVISILSPNVVIETIEIYNNLGQKIATKIVSETANNINISDLSAGLYFLKLFSNNELVKTERLIKL